MKNIKFKKEKKFSLNGKTIKANTLMAVTDEFAEECINEGVAVEIKTSISVVDSIIELPKKNKIK